MWAVGCIFAELMIRKLLFSGNDYVQQARKIFDCVGTPTEEDMTVYASTPLHKFVKEHYKRNEDVKNLRTLLLTESVEIPNGDIIDPQQTTDAADLIEQLLKLDPRKRIAAKYAVQHAFFSQYPNSGNPEFFEKELKANFTIDWSFAEFELTKTNLDCLIYDEIRSFQPEMPELSQLPDHLLDFDVSGVIAFAVALGLNFWKDFKTVIVKERQKVPVSLLSMDRTAIRNIFKFLKPSFRNCKMTT